MGRSPFGYQLTDLLARIDPYEGSVLGSLNDPKQASTPLIGQR
jgi:hypothetical protein